MKPLRFAEVELVDDNPFFDRHIAWDLTDENGAFSFEKDDTGSAIRNLESGGSRVDVKIRVRARNGAIRLSINLLGDLLTQETERGRKVKLGELINTQIDRVYGEYRILKAKSKKNATQYELEKVD